MNTRHSFQAGHAASGAPPRFSRGGRVPPRPLGCDDVEFERLIRPAATLPAGRPGLHALLNAWDRLAGPIPEDRLRDGLRSLRIDRHALWNCVRFDEQSYQRTRIHARDHYEVLVLCWRPGQGSPIHDHGGSTCAVLVVEGAATEIGFMATACGKLAPSRSQRVDAGAVIVSRLRDIHQMANLESEGTDLVSLHVFSPPLSGGRCYRLAETSLADQDALVDDPPTVWSAPI